MHADLKESVIQSIEKLLCEMQTASYRRGAAAVGVSPERLASEYIFGMFTSQIAPPTSRHSGETLENARLISAINQIDRILQVPAAEYVPAIRDVFILIDGLGLAKSC